jgi:hypothetical protein
MALFIQSEMNECISRIMVVSTRVRPLHVVLAFAPLTLCQSCRLQQFLTDRQPIVCSNHFKARQVAFPEHEPHTLKAIVSRSEKFAAKRANVFWQRERS